jgi:hypothetical protein
MNEGVEAHSKLGDGDKRKDWLLPACMEEKLPPIEGKFKKPLSKLCILKWQSGIAVSPASIPTSSP